MSKLNDCIDILKTFAIYDIDLEYSTEHYHITVREYSNDYKD